MAETRAPPQVDASSHGSPVHLPKLVEVPRLRTGRFRSPSHWDLIHFQRSFRTKPLWIGGLNEAALVQVKVQMRSIRRNRVREEPVGRDPPVGNQCPAHIVNSGALAAGSRD